MTSTTTVGGVLYYHQPAFSPTNKHLYVPCESSVKVYSVKTGQLTSTVDGFNGAVTGVRFSGDRLLVCSLGGDLVAYSVDNIGKKTTELWRVKMDVPVHQVVPMDDDNVLVVSRVVANQKDAAADTAFCRAYPKESHSFIYKVNTVTGNVVPITGGVPGRAIIDYRDGYLFMADRQSASVSVINTDDTVTTVHQFKLKRAAMCMQVALGAVDAEDAFMAIGDGTGRITIWYYKHATTPHHHLLLHWHSDAVRSIACLPSGYLLSAGRESVLVLWRINDHYKRFLPKIGDCLEHVAVAGDWSRFAVSTRANKIHLVEAASFRVPDHQPAIVGMSGFGVGCRLLGDPIFAGSDSTTIVYKGANGTIQAHDIAKDKHVGQVAAVELLLTDPSGPASDIAHIPDIEAFSVSSAGGKQWMATVEGRPGLTPHFGYLKLWERQNGYDFQYNCHTIIHRPHHGPVSHVIVEQLESGEWLCVTVSAADTFKVFKLEEVYDEARLERRLAWRPFYADPVKGGPTAVGLSPSGKLAIAYQHSIVIVDLKPLVDGALVHPPLLCKLKMKAMKRPINKLVFTNDSCLVAATNYDIFKIQLDNTGHCLHWSVQNRAISVSPSGDRLACLAMQPNQPKESWLLEFRLSDLAVTGRRQLSGVGRAVLCGADATVAVHGDGLVTLFGRAIDTTVSSEASTASEAADERESKRQRLIDSLTPTQQPAPPAQKCKRAAPCKSRAHLHSLTSTSELPPVRDLFSKFILPRIRI